MKRKYPKTVAIAVWADGKVLIAKRKNTKTYDGYWAFPGGKVEKKETILDAVNRELYEETGLYISHNNLELVDCIILDPTTEKCFLYETTIRPSDIDKVVNKEKHKSHDWVWLTPKEVLQKQLLPGIKEYLEDK